MKIICQSFRIKIPSDEKILYSVGGGVSVFDISGEKVVKLNSFNKLKNSSNIAISANGEKIMYKNTSGHIAVHEVKTGELLLKSKALSEEGYDLFFINNDEQILTSEWEGTVFILDIKTKAITIVARLPIHGTNMVPVSDNKFIVFGSDKYGKYTRIFELLIQKDFDCKELLFTPEYRVEEVCAVVCGEDIFFLAFEKGRKKSCVISFNFIENNICHCFNVEELMGIQNNLIEEYGYFTCICISRDRRYLLIGLSDSVLTFDLLQKKHIGTHRKKYISSLHFISSDKKVVIGTWKNIQIVDFESLLF